MNRSLGVGLALALFAIPEVSRSAEEKSDGVVHLFNGKDLTHFYTFLIAPEDGGKPLGKNNDPRKVFTVQDGAIRVSGEVYGCFTTEKEFENYHLVTEFKWGEQTWGRRKNATRDSGILVHCQGQDGNFGPWMESYECQMIEGGTGDFLVLSDKKRPRSLSVETVKRTVNRPKPHEETYYQPGAPELTLTAGRFNWFARSPDWHDVKGFRGQEDVEKPVGEWNRLECVCAGDEIIVILNGRVVNVGRKATVTKGKILFQSEGAEVFFRRIDLKPIKVNGSVSN